MCLFRTATHPFGHGHQEKTGVTACYAVPVCIFLMLDERRIFERDAVPGVRAGHAARHWRGREDAVLGDQPAPSLSRGPRGCPDAYRQGLLAPAKLTENSRPFRLVVALS